MTDTEKHSKAGQDDRFIFAVSEMQGWRICKSSFHSYVIPESFRRGRRHSHDFVDAISVAAVEGIQATGTALSCRVHSVLPLLLPFNAVADVDP